MKEIKLKEFQAAKPAEESSHVRINSTFSNLKFFAPESNKNLNAILSDKTLAISKINDAIQLLTTGKVAIRKAPIHRKRGRTILNERKKLSSVDSPTNLRDQIKIKEKRVSIGNQPEKKKLPGINRKLSILRNSEEIIPPLLNKRKSVINLDHNKISLFNKRSSIIHPIVSTEAASDQKDTIFLTKLAVTESDINSQNSSSHRKSMSIPDNYPLLTATNRSRNNNVPISFSNRLMNVVTEQITHGRNRIDVKNQLYKELDSQQEFVTSFDKMVKSSFTNEVSSFKRKHLENINNDRDLLLEEKRDPQKNDEAKLEARVERLKNMDKVYRLNDDLVFKYREIIMQNYKIAHSEDKVETFGMFRKKSNFNEKQVNTDHFHQKVEDILKNSIYIKQTLLKKMEK